MEARSTFVEDEEKSLGGWGDHILDDGTGARSLMQLPFAYLV